MDSIKLEYIIVGLYWKSVVSSTYYLRFGKWSRLEQWDGLQSTTFNFLFF
jgi:hypothetical protein